MSKVKRLRMYLGGQFIGVVRESDYDRLEAENKALREALHHIRKTCEQSRTETRRLRWIAQRAQWAIDGRPYDDSAFDLPKDATGSNEKLKRELEALRSRVVVLPNRRDPFKFGHMDPDQLLADGFNSCLDELARLNGKTVSAGLLYRIAETLDDVCHGSALEKELRALLDEGREVGDAAGH
ncbi:hypothetical protein D3C76_47790 [compost metagenome]